MHEDFGILYVATGAACLKEAHRSARSARAQMSAVPTAIFTDCPESVAHELFDSVYPLPNPTFSSYDKIEPLAATPFNRTLFLDSDTLVLDPLNELAYLLDRFELAYCHAPVRFEEGDFPGCNEAFPQGNSGVILYRRNEGTRALFTSWAELYRTRKHSYSSTERMLDQPSFRETVYRCDLRFAILPCEYNLRTCLPYFAGARARVKILHGRDPELTAASLAINERLHARIGDFRKGRGGASHV